MREMLKIFLKNKQDAHLAVEFFLIFCQDAQDN